ISTRWVKSVPSKVNITAWKIKTNALPVIEKDVFEAVDYFFMYGEIPNGCNSNFIALIMGVNVEDGMVKNAASKLGCLVLKTPFTYLGTKVGGNMSRKQAWKEVVDKVLSRLSRWKMNSF
ncbi:hypothetical protein Tco_0722600, partial [Tanacetum coccineum]